MAASRKLRGTAKPTDGLQFYDAGRARWVSRVWQKGVELGRRMGQRNSIRKRMVGSWGTWKSRSIPLPAKRKGGLSSRPPRISVNSCRRSLEH